MTRMNRMGFMILVLMLAAGTAHADRFVSWQGGVFSPWNGHTGYSFAIQMGADFGDRSHWAFETEYRDFNGEIYRRRIRAEIRRLDGVRAWLQNH